MLFCKGALEIFGDSTQYLGSKKSRHGQPVFKIWEYHHPGEETEMFLEWQKVTLFFDQPHWLHSDSNHACGAIMLDDLDTPKECTLHGPKLTRLFNSIQT